ncbi:MAG TPA: acyl-CoA thioesterase [Deltaproteobacteria bacterium]|nr:acyl-CoA thioesterase [Deltaproteobacteria bacterium]
MPGPRFHEQVMGVYFDDLDAFYILHNARYLLLFERTLGSFWQSIGVGAFEPQRAGDHQHLVRANTIEYLKPVRGTGSVRVRVWVERLGRTSLTFGFRLMPLDEDTDHAVGTRTIVRVDPTTQRPAPWTEAFRQRLAPWTSEPGGGAST